MYHPASPLTNQRGHFNTYQHGITQPQPFRTTLQQIQTNSTRQQSKSPRATILKPSPQRVHHNKNQSSTANSIQQLERDNKMLASALKKLKSQMEQKSRSGPQSNQQSAQLSQMIHSERKKWENQLKGKIENSLSDFKNEIQSLQSERASL